MYICNEFQRVLKSRQVEGHILQGVIEIIFSIRTWRLDIQRR